MQINAECFVKTTSPGLQNKHMILFFLSERLSIFPLLELDALNSPLLGVNLKMVRLDYIGKI